MELEVVSEHGLEFALEGMLYSYQQECGLSYIPKLNNDKAMRVALKLCTKDQGHSKFLEHIQVWFRLRAPLYFYKQFDTYRVGTSKLSKSTMHTLMKRELTENDFVGSISGIDDAVISIINMYIGDKDFDAVNRLLPQSFLQTRMVNLNYKVLRNIIQQREGHKLQEWDQFIREVTNQLQNPELLGLGVFL